MYAYSIGSSCIAKIELFTYSLVLAALAESAFVALLLLATVAADETALFVSLVLFTVAAVKFPEVVSAFTALLLLALVVSALTALLEVLVAASSADTG